MDISIRPEELKQMVRKGSALLLDVRRKLITLHSLMHFPAHPGENLSRSMYKHNKAPQNCQEGGDSNE